MTKYRLDDFFKEYSSMTLPALTQFIGGIEKTWDAYFNGEMDDGIVRNFEGMIGAPTKAAAFLLSGFIAELRQIVEVLKR